MKKEIECKIEGRVQGVNFREYVKRKAEIFDITGWVKNMEDGSVLVIAQGNQKNLREFIILLEKGPRSAIVENVSVRWKEIKEDLMDFYIC